MSENLDIATVTSFGDEWTRFDQSKLSDAEAKKIFDEYFAVFPWFLINGSSAGFDMGCGSGRWAKLMAPHVGHLHCIDPSAALDIARQSLDQLGNLSFHQASVDDNPLPQQSQDFGYSLGVLHHVPDTLAAIKACAAMLKPGAPFLIYLYYAFDNRSFGFKLVWRCSDVMRRIICKLPSGIKHAVTDIIAAAVYYPLARLSLLLDKFGINVDAVPLSYYRNHTFFTMRTDSRDRFGTPLEKRFTKVEIRSMLESAGFQDIRFSEQTPYWCAVGIKK